MLAEWVLSCAAKRGMKMCVQIRQLGPWAPTQRLRVKWLQAVKATVLTDHRTMAHYVSSKPKIYTSPVDVTRISFGESPRIWSSSIRWTQPAISRNVKELPVKIRKIGSPGCLVKHPGPNLTPVAT